MPTMIDVFAKVREHERLEQLKVARELDALPYFRVLEGPTLPVVEMEGRPRVMLGSNNYLGLTGDERVRQGALDAIAKYGTGLTGSRFLNGTIDLHLELEDELAQWLQTEAALVFTTGHQANLGALGTILGRGRHGDRRLGRPRLDPRRLHPLGRQAAAVSPQPARPPRARAQARHRGRRRHPGRRRRGLLDGGRRRPAARDRRPVRRVRRPADGRRGSRAGGARRPRGGDERAARASRTASTCGWPPSPSRWPPAAG